MARSRNIKPGFFTNDELGELDPLARLLFAGLWCHADREGRLEDRPKKLKAEILPYDDCDCDGLLSDLHGAGFILRYVVDGIAYIQCLNFLKHQNPHVKEQASTIPAPCTNNTRTGQEPDKNNKNTEVAGLIPSSLIPDSLNHLKPLGGKPPDARFEECWKRYPKRSGNNPKADALKAWNARLKEGVPVEQLERGLDRYLGWCESTGKVGAETVMQAVRFFGKSRPFEQDWELPKKPINGAGKPDTSWLFSDKATQDHGRALGIEPRIGESMDAYRDRLRVAR